MSQPIPWLGSNDDRFSVANSNNCIALAIVVRQAGTTTNGTSNSTGTTSTGTTGTGTPAVTETPMVTVTPTP